MEELEARAARAAWRNGRRGRHGRRVVPSARAAHRVCSTAPRPSWPTDRPPTSPGLRVIGRSARLCA
eukprot:6243736-Prymnesium_polylepis.1